MYKRALVVFGFYGARYRVRGIQFYDGSGWQIVVLEELP